MRTDFLSHNCLREINATVDQKKAYMFVHESDAAKGGAPLDLLQKELGWNLRKTLFDGQSVTEWHRTTDFQLVSYASI